MDWNDIRTILLDLDGTLLDRAFDDHFYLELLPRRYARINGISVQDARTRLTALYRAAEGELQWTDLDYWTRTLGIDVTALKASVCDDIRPHPDAREFLEFLRTRRVRIHLVTNAHPKALAIKMAQTGLNLYFDSVVSAFDVGCLKLKPDFWTKSHVLLGFDPARTVYIDDDEMALASARSFGIKHLYLRSKPSSTLPAQGSRVYDFIETFHELMK